MSEHLATEILDGYRQRTLSVADLLTADEHLTGCASCRQALGETNALRTLAVGLQANLATAAITHLSFEQLEEYVEQTLRGTALTSVEQHLQSCARCGEEAQSLRAFVGELSTYPEKEFAPLAPPTVLEKTGLISWRERLAHLFPMNWQLAGAAAAVVLITLASVWVWRSRSNQPDDSAIARQTTPTPVVTVTPDATPAVTPTPETTSSPEILIALNDGSGTVTLDKQGQLAGLSSVSPTAQQQIKTALSTQRVTTPADLKNLAAVIGNTMSLPQDKPLFNPISPKGIVVITPKPTLRWEPLEGATSYNVEVYDVKGEFIAGAEGLKETSWVIPENLSPGRVYDWQVRVQNVKEGKAPSARFRVLEKNKADEIERVRKAQPKAHLALGVLYAQAGLLEEAEREFKALVAANPKSPEAQKLLRSLQAQRR